MKNKTLLRSLAALACCYLVLVAVGSIKGCVSHELPAPLTAAEQARVQHTRFALTLGLQRPQRPDRWDAEIPLAALRGTGLFKSVDYVDRLPSAPDVLVRGDTIIDGTPTIPIFTIATLGAFPTKSREGWGYAYSFQAPHPGAGAIEVSVAHKGTTVLGWMSGFYNLSADWAKDAPIENQRLYDRLALELAAKSDEISRLAAHKPD